MLESEHRYNFPITVKHRRLPNKPYRLKAQRVCGISPYKNWLMPKGTRVENTGEQRVVGLAPHKHE